MLSSAGNESIAAFMAEHQKAFAQNFTPAQDNDEERKGDNYQDYCINLEGLITVLNGLYKNRERALFEANDVQKQLGWADAQQGSFMGID